MVAIPGPFCYYEHSKSIPLEERVPRTHIPLTATALLLLLGGCTPEAPTGFARSVGFSLVSASPATTLSGVVVRLPVQPGGFSERIRGVTAEQRADLHPLLFLPDPMDRAAPQLSLSLLRRPAATTYVPHRWGYPLGPRPELIATYRVPESGGVRHYDVTDGEFVIEAMHPAPRGRFRFVARQSYFVGASDPIGTTYESRPESLVIEGRFGEDR